MDKPRMVVCAAIRRKNDGYVLCGPRHFDKTMREGIMDSEQGDDWLYVDQGFIDQYGVFMTREEAYEVAKAAGQIKYRCGGDEGCLFSENLY